MYVLPFLIYAPRLARNVLQYRYSILDKARQRARADQSEGRHVRVAHHQRRGGVGVYAAGTAQYHINAAIAHAIMKYVNVTGDREFLYEYGAEILVETARLWFDLGFFSERRDGRFCIHRVTGPDEYTTVVNNNTYTNLMARENLRCAADAVERCARPARTVPGPRPPNRTRAWRAGGLATGGRADVRTLRRQPRESTRRTTSSST